MRPAQLIGTRWALTALCAWALSSWPSASVAQPSQAPQAPSGPEPPSAQDVRPAQDAPSDQDADALGLQAVERSVLERHPDIAGQRAAMRRAQGALLEAQGSFDTSLIAKPFLNPWVKNYGWVDLGVKQPTTLWGATFEAGWRFGAGAIPIYKQDYKTNTPGGEAYAALAVPLWRDGPIDARRLKITQADLKVQEAEQDLGLVRLELGLEAIDAYFTWVEAGLKWRVELDLLQLALERQDGLDARVQRGDLPEITAVENQRAIFRRRGAAAAAELKLVESALKLSIFLRDDQGQPLVPGQARLPKLDALDPNPYDPAALTQDLQLALRERPELRALKLKRQQLQAQRQWADNQLAPQVDLQAGVAKSLYPSTLEADAQSELFVGLNVQLYLQQRKAQGALDQAEAELLQIDAKAQLVRDKIVAELTAAHAQQRLAAQQAQFAARELENAQRLEQAERDRLTAGDTTWLIVNLREQATADAAKRLVEATAAAAAARARYRWLRSPPSPPERSRAP